jgi:mannose/fructose/N-acetylgalactosamine-specific phosphotransferase system component IIC
VTLSHLVLAAVVGGLLTVERKAFLQAGLSRPLVASALLGLCLGDVPAGLVVGAPLELLFLGAANLGASLSDHETLAACAVAAASAAAARGLGALSLPAAGLAMFALVPFGILGRLLDGAENQVHQKFADKAMQLVEQGQYRAALRMNWRALWFPFGSGAIATLVGAGAGLALAPALRDLGPHPRDALSSAFLFASAVCAAAAVRGARHPRGIIFALLAGAITLGAVMASP